MGSQTYDVAALDQVPPGGMLEVAVAGEKVLLVSVGGSLTAISGTCPHAGAPLSEGVLDGERIICPWHKAVFCTRTGALLEPPSVDALARYDVRVEGGRVLLSEPEPELASPQASDARCFVIIGAGAAGALAAQTLREEGFQGRVVMLDRENRVPYDRTLLSKYFLSGESGAEKTPLQPQSFYRENKIERLTAEVIRVRPLRRLIDCADGLTLSYDAALLATGASPELPDLPGAGLPGVFMLRTKADAETLLARAERSRTAVILGASFIGMEVAASLRERGLEVTVVGREAAPFEKQLGPRVGAAFVSLHDGHGVGFRLAATIGAIEPQDAGLVVRLADGESLAADLVVIGFGVAPVTGYLEDIELGEDGGLPVDGNLRVADRLYAAGDIARFPLQGDGDPIRVEHWRVAQQQGRIAALNMLGHATPYDAVPVFWTIQYMKRLDYVGHAAQWDDVVIHGDLDASTFIAYYVKDGRVLAAAGMDRDQDMAALMVLLGRSNDWTPQALGSSPKSLLIS